MTAVEQAETASLNDVQFCEEVERFVTEVGLSYMDALVHVCEREHIDIDDVGSLVNVRIKEFVRREASKLRMLPPTASLPF